MSKRRRDRQGRATAGPYMVPWYYRYGYHLGVWSGATIGVIWYAIFQELVGLIAGVVLGQATGVFLSMRGRRR